MLSIGNDVTIVKLGPAPSEVALSCIGNGGSFANLALAPNEIASLFGAGLGPAQQVTGQPNASGVYPFQLGGTQVTFDGSAAPVLYVSSGQINVVTPHALQGKSTTHVCAIVNNTATNCIDMPVELAVPGIFGSVNQDGTINSAQNPAPAGSVVSLFVTGLGTVTPSTPDGGITPDPPPTQDVKIRALFMMPTHDNRNLSFGDIRYAGPAPLEVEGLSQINVVAPPLPFDSFGSVPRPIIQIQVNWGDGNTWVNSPQWTAIWIK